MFKKSGISKKGSPYEFYWQEAQAETARFRQPVNISVPSETEGYPAGEYAMDVEAFLKVDGFNEFQTERYPALVPAKKAA